MSEPRSNAFPVALEPFAKMNPEARVRLEDQMVIVEKPWGDASLRLRFSQHAEAIVRVLNQLRLPPLFSAMWHQNTHDLEFIYSPVKARVHGRKFQFQYSGKTYGCRFDNCSDRLLTLA